MSTHHASTSNRSNRGRDLGAALARAEHEMHRGSVVQFAGPPPEVQREMAEAERLWRDLEAQGREVRFERRPDGRVSVALTDIASGRSLDEIGPIGLFRLLDLAV